MRRKPVKNRFAPVSYGRTVYDEIAALRGAFGPFEQQLAAFDKSRDDYARSIYGDFSDRNDLPFLAGFASLVSFDDPVSRAMKDRYAPMNEIGAKLTARPLQIA